MSTLAPYPNRSTIPLEGLSDVDASAVTDQDVVYYDAASHKFKGKAQSALSVDLGVAALLKPSGGNDRTQLANAVASPGLVLLEAGTLTLTAGGTIGLGTGKVGLTLKGAGRDKTTIQLSAGCPELFRVDSSANTDVAITDILLEDFTLDVNNVVGTGAVLLGNQGVGSLRTSFARIRFRRVNIINCPTPSTGGNNRSGVWLNSRHTASGQTLSTITDVDVDDCDFNGGNTGVYIGASGVAANGPANCLIDRITIPKFRHDCVTLITAGYASANVQIGSLGRCGSVKIGTVWGANSADPAIEIDNCRELDIGTLFTENPRNHGAYIRNIGWALGNTGLVSQRAKIGHIEMRVTAAAAMLGQFALSSTGNTAATQYGDIEVGTIKVESTQAAGINPGAINMQNAAVRSLDVEAVHWALPVLNDAATTNTLTAVSLQPVSDMRVRIGKMHSILAGTYSAGRSLPISVSDFSGTAAKLWLEIDGFDVEHNLSGATPELALLGVIPNAAGISLGGHLRRLRVRQAGQQFYGCVRMSGTGKLTMLGQFIADDLDFGGAAAGGGGEFSFPVDGAGTNRAGVFMGRIRYRDGTTSSPVGSVFKLTATNASWPIPKNAQQLRITAVGGGGGGAGGGSSSAIANQQGGSGGGPGVEATQVVTVDPLGAGPTTLNAQIGAGGTGGAGGAAGGNPGSNAGAAGNTTVTATGISVQGNAGGTGRAPAANSATQVAPVAFGTNVGQVAPFQVVVTGGFSGNAGGAAFGHSPGGGGGGGTTSATNGGNGGAAGSQAGGAGGSTGGSASAAGANGADATLPGAGGGGGGGGAWNGGAGGAGGTGGKGGDGYVVVQVVA